jgi:hypothetical protein
VADKVADKWAKELTNEHIISIIVTIVTHIMPEQGVVNVI